METLNGIRNHGFRVTLDLTMVDDFRKHSIMYIDPLKLSTIDNLKQEIRDEFQVDEDFRLFVNDRFIQQNANIHIIKAEDALKAVSLTPPPTTTKKRKKPPANTLTNGHVAEPTLAATTKTSKPEEPNSTMESQENGEVPAKKPKRVRTRPSKKKQQEANLMMIQQASTPPENATMATIQALNSAQNRHVRFSDDPEHISDKAPENTDLTANADILTELKTYRMQFESVGDTNANSTEDVETKLHKLFEVQRNFPNTVFTNQAEGQRLCETNVIKSTLKLENPLMSYEEAIHLGNHLREVDPHTCPLMNRHPQKGDYIAFKVTRLGENFTPEFSRFLVARVEDTQLEPSQPFKFTCKVLRGIDQLRNFGGSSVLDESNCNGELVTLDLDLIKDLRLITLD